ncbi:NAD(P)/FAD-dependent oxidoreductase [Rhodococcus sp. NCIMB 12038]|uniref:flavin-containing monooxygenase n=1 Tax=Rhodococcus sp. NCIMB 12038 TaxID=933800 RepID=UPI000B3CBF26|nr:NAD(P)/FAD-dependent oxidoreductase [Rhodococcus sp. NCIMB 12038]OUS96777.1 cyclohexanone monooxygenase [Rhodococcus sp. NCIMB 12038]
MATPTQAPSSHEVDVIVVGAGFAGLRALHSLRSAGKRVAVLEAGTGIGGVWFWNRYPGARCDIESYDYSYGFDPDLEQEWRWTQRYAQQPEILAYIEHVADRFDLRRDVHLEQHVTQANWDAEGRCWDVATEAGDQWRGRYLIWAVGNLSATKRPPLPGTEDFTGRIVHTAEWPHEGVDVTGLRVGVVGTGSSGMQSIPILAKEADHLTVFQRTPNFSVPARHHAISDQEDAQVKAGYRERRRRVLESPTGLGFRPRKESALEVSEAERTAAFETAWDGAGFGFALTYRDLLLDIDANATAAEFIRDKIAATVKDPSVRDLLTPQGYPFGAKRPVVDDGYFETFNRDDVTLVDIRTDGLVRVTSEGLETESGKTFPLDVLVFATGFDAMTGSLLRPEIVGRDGLTLREKWSNGPTTHLGLGTHGFPNMFVIAGPGSPALLINVLVGIELHVDWIVELLAEADNRGTEVIEVEAEAEAAWGAHLEQRAQETLYPKARSYYMGDEIPGKPRVFMLYSGGLRNYRRLLTDCAAGNYSGFELTKD